MNKQIIRSILIIFLFSQGSLIEAQSIFGEEEIIADRSSITRDVGKILPLDLDNDGDLDMLVTSVENNELVWLENLDGQGSFGPKRVIYKDAENPRRIRYADMNGDGISDIIIGSTNWPSVEWIEHLDGNGNFGEATRAISSASIFIPGDIDGDGDNDLVYTAGAIYWAENLDGLGDFPFSGHEIASNGNSNGYESIALKDMDGDEDLDVISSSYGRNEIIWYENNGNGTFNNEFILMETPDFPSKIIVEDIDGDGDNDIVAAFAESSTLGWFENIDGQDNFSEINLVSDNIQNFLNFTTGDFDGDTNLDLASITDNRVIQLFTNEDGQGNYSAGTILAETPFLYDPEIEIGDFDNNGQDDLVLGDWNSLTLFKSNTNTPITFEEGINVSTLIRESGIHQVADINGDGHEDFVAISRQNEQLFWYPNTGNGTYLTPVFISQYIPNLEVFDLSDFDGDGDLDVVTSIEINGNHSLIWFDNIDGTGKFASRQPVVDINFKPQRIINVDIDGDNDMDILIYAGELTTNKELYWIENIDNSSEFGSPKILLTSSIRAHTLDAIDFDEDGDLDIIYGSGSFFSWFENIGGPEMFSERQTIFSNNDGYYIFKWVDFDEDGDRDLLARSNENISWFEKINGSVMFSAPEIMTSIDNTEVEDMILVDIDMDNDKDLIVSWRSDTGNAINYLGYHINNGSYDFSERINIGRYPSGGRDCQIFALDADQDNDLDIIWQSDGTVNAPGDIKQYRNQFNASRFSGKFFLDENENTIQDPDEPVLTGRQAILSPSGAISYSDQSGSYNFPSSAGDFTITTNSDAVWSLTTDSLFTFNSNGSSISEFDFGLKPNQIIKNLSVSVNTPITRCNTNAPIFVNYKNTGTEKMSGKIKFVNENLTSLINSIPEPDEIIGDTLYWNFSDLQPTEEKRIKISLEMPNESYFGSILKFDATIYSLENNNLSLLDSDLSESELRCAYDPNDKLVTPRGIGSEGYILNEDTLEYTIRFQNTGNDTAFLVRIFDQLENRLEVNSFRPVTASHDYSVIRRDDKLEFVFENINLPDSTTNFEGSQGFVTFQINLIPNIWPGNSVENYADIVFDYNPPITTNTVINTIYDCLNQTPIILDELPNGTFCLNSGPVALPIVSPGDGMFIGPGITGDSIYLDDLGPGSFEYFYEFTDDLNCINVASFDLEIAICTSLKEEENISINIFPNPFKESITVKSGEFNSSRFSCILYNVLGIVQRKIDLTSNSIQVIPTIDLSSGVYFYEVVDDKNVRVLEGKVIKN